jgi:hypothetical protein
VLQMVWRSLSICLAAPVTNLQSTKLVKPHFEIDHGGGQIQAIVGPLCLPWNTNAGNQLDFGSAYHRDTLADLSDQRTGKMNLGTFISALGAGLLALACSSDDTSTAPGANGGAAGDASAGQSGSANGGTAQGGASGSGGGGTGGTTPEPDAGEPPAPPACTKNADCTTAPATLCDVPSGRCVECKQKSDCTGGNVCNVPLGECTSPCGDGGGCSGGSICNTAKGLCVECLSKAQCTTADESLCNQATGECVQCITSADCKTAALPECDPATHLCVAG